MPANPSVLVPRRAESVMLKKSTDLFRREELKESGSFLLVSGMRQHHSALIEFRITVRRHFPITSFIFHAGRERVRQGNESRLRIAGFHKLRCLGDVFS